MRQYVMERGKAGSNGDVPFRFAEGDSAFFGARKVIPVTLTIGEGDSAKSVEGRLSPAGLFIPKDAVGSIKGVNGVRMTVQAEGVVIPDAAPALTEAEVQRRADAAIAAKLAALGLTMEDLAALAPAAQQDGAEE